MKRILLLIPAVLLPSCASHKAVVVRMPHSVPGTTLPAQSMESIRYSENLKAYPVGRYVEPNNSLVMHEAHTVYRVETTAKWNLHPHRPASMPGGPAVGLIDPARKDGPTTAEVVAEVNRQKAATQAVLAEGARISQTLNQLAANVSVTKQISEENAQLKAAVNTTAKRLEALEEQFRQKQPDTAFTTPPVPAFRETNGW
jgi:hypothetical protein